MNEVTQTPDELLTQLKQQEERSGEGRLKIFFGMCAGVGKTYAMLEAARKARADKIDIVAGLVETHRRQDTEALLAGLEQIPRRVIHYHGSEFGELDLDAILARRPALVLVDELAHSNIPGSRHMKRYQDVLELLQNGISVYTTVNVQHIESRSEVVRQITGIQIRETVPDSILERADAIELIDLTPEELLQRLREGKVYTADKTKQAIENYFRVGNLTALREMALRLTAERVDKDLTQYKQQKRISSVWKSSQKFMVAIGPGPHSAELIRFTRRLAYSMEIAWVAAFVETERELPAAARESLSKNIDLARELGAEIVSIQDTDVAQGLVRIAKLHNVTQIMVGKSRRQLAEFLRPGRHFTSRLMRLSGDIDVYVIGGEAEEEPGIWKEFFQPTRTSVAKYLQAIVLISILSAVLYYLHFHIGYQTVALIFLFVIMLMPLLDFGPGPILLAACLSAYNWDFFFIPPAFTLFIGRVEDAMMFGMYFIVAAVSGYLTSRIRAQKILLDRREKRTTALYALSRELSSASSMQSVLDVSIRHLMTAFKLSARIILSDEERRLQRVCHASDTPVMSDLEWSAAQWVFQHTTKAGRFTNTLPLTEATYYPVATKSGTLGVIGLVPLSAQKPPLEMEIMLETFLAQISSAIEREYLDELARKHMINQESEKLYRTLFDSISHEMKTPITTIKGVVAALLNERMRNDAEVVAHLVKETGVAADRLNRLVENMLDMARLESGNLKPKKEWHAISDLINSVVQRVCDDDIRKQVSIEAADEQVLAEFDYVLIEQALVNILRNAFDYTPAGSRVTIRTGSLNKKHMITIADSGTGVPEELLPKIFEKFYRVPGTGTGGTGLGLSITRGFIEAHGGSITARNISGGGLEFVILLP